MSLAIVIPFYNEKNRIVQTLTSLSEALRGMSFRCVLVNDCSNDQSLTLVENYIGENKLEWVVITNETNVGHGPSVLNGLKWAIKNDFDYIATLDGDGEIDFTDFGRMIEIGLDMDDCIVEGIRKHRHQEISRRMVSLICKYIVVISTNKRTLDANTPIHFFPKNSLKELLSKIPDNLSTPNILISILIRRGELRATTTDIRVTIPESNQGVTWSGKTKITRVFSFLKFSIKSFSEIRKFMFKKKES